MPQHIIHVYTMTLITWNWHSLFFNFLVQRTHRNKYSSNNNDSTVIYLTRYVHMLLIVNDIQQALELSLPNYVLPKCKSLKTFYLDYISQVKLQYTFHVVIIVTLSGYIFFCQTFNLQQYKWQQLKTYS